MWEPTIGTKPLVISLTWFIRIKFQSYHNTPDAIKEIDPTVAMILIGENLHGDKTVWDSDLRVVRILKVCPIDGFIYHL